MKIKEAKSTIVFNSISYVLLAVVSLICVLPFVIILSGSFTNNETILTQGYSILPRDITLEAYKTIFRFPKGILQAYKMTIFYTAIGTLVGLLLIAMTAYVISRKEFKYRNRISFLIYFTSIFGGGLIPWYLMYSSVLNLKGSTFVIWFPAIMSPFLIILMRTFITDSVPNALTEAAKLDGAGHVTIFLRVVMPIIKPALATVGLFLALGFWNDWYRSSMFSTDSSTWELQFYLYDMLNSSTAVQQMSSGSGTATAEIPGESVKLAMAVVTTGPILLLYPFVQKYFVSGITIGAVKG